MDFKKKEDQLKQLFSRFGRLAGSIAVDHFDNSFRNTGFTDRTLEKWKPVRDRRTGKEKQRPLVETGRLRRSVHAKEDSAGVSIIADAPYAAIHNEGSKVEGSAEVRAHSRSKGKGSKKKTSQVRAHSRKVNYTMPKRQFIGDSHQLDEKIKKMMMDEIDQIL